MDLKIENKLNRHRVHFRSHKEDLLGNHRLRQGIRSTMRLLPLEDSFNQFSHRQAPENLFSQLLLRQVTREGHSHLLLNLKGLREDFLLIWLNFSFNRNRNKILKTLPRYTRGKVFICNFLCFMLPSL